MIRVLIVDGQAEVRRGLRMRLAIEPDITVVGETGSVEEAIGLAQALTPDAVVIDVESREPDGADIIHRLREASPAAAIVVLTLYGDEDERARAHESGAEAFMEKYGGAADLLQTIRQIVVVSPGS